MGARKYSLLHTGSCEYTSTLLLTKTTAAQNEVALSYRRVYGLYFLTVVFAATNEFIHHLLEI